MVQEFRDTNPEFQYRPWFPHSDLLGHKTLLLQRAMWERGVKVVIPEGNSASLNTQRWAAKHGSQVLIFYGTMLAHSTFFANRVVQNKAKTKEVLQSRGLRVAHGITTTSERVEDAVKWFESLGSKKVVIKPIMGSLGRGIVLGVDSKESLRTHLQNIGDGEIVLEEQIPGDDYRVLVVGGKFMAAMRRDRAHVIGNGSSTLEQLIREKNDIRRKIPFNGNYLLRLDEAARSLVAAQGIEVDAPVPAGVKVELRCVSNIGAGGDSVDVTAHVHPHFVEIAESAANSFDGLECAGVDFMAEDLSAPPESQEWALLEINANSDLPIHHWPSVGIPQDVAGLIAGYYFPASQKTRVANKITLFGRVQRVGVQGWLEKRCTLLGISGYSKAVGDNSVEIHAEGSDVAIEQLIEDCIAPTEKAIVRRLEVDSVTVAGYEYFSMKEA